ncbi:polysaccharide deacetylase family protein [Dankookia sp. P2]|uniref:polysaccharide deacetylase family protein n=1 Tax=Dankookia sp. P2 TaxID=3423955 RepID=UPI003D67C923
MPAFDMRVNWPNGARVAVMLTFDFDAETLWMARDPENARRPGILSQGKYGAKVGVPKILETLEDAAVPATFFIPGWTVENHTGRCEMILKAGHEIGHHSYSHEWIALDDTAKEVEEMERGLHALKSRLGVVPKGYRSPAGETSENLISPARQARLHLQLLAARRHQPLSPHHAGRTARPDRAALALEPGRRALCAVLHQGPAADLPEQPPEGDLPGRVPGDPSLGRHLQPGHAPAGQRPAEPHRAAARDDRLDARIPWRLVRQLLAGRRGLGRPPRRPLRGCRG